MKLGLKSNSLKNKIYITIVLVIIVLVLALITRERHSGYSKLTEINLLTTTFDFGVIKTNSLSSFDVKILINTSEPLLIYSTNKSTELLGLFQKPKYYKTFDTIKIPVNYYSNDKIGLIDEFIILRGNFKEKELKIKIKGKVID